MQLSIQTLFIAMDCDCILHASSNTFASNFLVVLPFVRLSLQGFLQSDGKPCSWVRVGSGEEFVDCLGSEAIKAE